jgi:hypothetical protein
MSARVLHRRCESGEFHGVWNRNAVGIVQELSVAKEYRMCVMFFRLILN